MSEDENTFPEKWLKKLPTGFAEDADAMDVDGLKRVVVECENNAYNIEKEKEADPKYNAAKELAKDLSLPYREAKTAQMMKIKYCIYLLQGKGITIPAK